MEKLEFEKSYKLINRIISEVEKAVIGKREVLELVALALLTDSHVLIEDYPGLAKTLMAKSFASALGLEFKRIQFTSDLLPSDIIGSFVFNRETSKFEFRKGPIFANVILADEINRAPPRTQSALLESMQERQVTVENETFKLSKPFIVLATQNPIEYEGTYPLPEAQLDRFIMKISIGYPSFKDEVAILTSRIERKSDEVKIEKVASAKDVLYLQEMVENVYVSDEIKEYIVRIVTATRKAPEVEVGASVRGSLALLKLSRARALMQGRDFVIPDDVKYVAIPALRHRLILKPEFWLKGIKPDHILEKILKEVPVPKY
ncbi:MAG: AAA family ATPase [Thermoproteota archaeon]|jgi:MoxR-like ATPase